jgi:hypothetical protein
MVSNVPHGIPALHGLPDCASSIGVLPSLDTNAKQKQWRDERLPHPQEPSFVPL